MSKKSTIENRHLRAKSNSSSMLSKSEPHMLKLGESRAALHLAHFSREQKKNFEPCNHTTEW